MVQLYVRPAYTSCHSRESLAGFKLPFPCTRICVGAAAVPQLAVYAPVAVVTVIRRWASAFASDGQLQKLVKLNYFFNYNFCVDAVNWIWSKEQYIR